MTDPAAVAPEATPPEEHTSRSVYVVVLAVVLAMVLGTLDTLVLGTAMPTIVADIGGADHLSWVITAYALATAVSTPVWGKIGDMYGRKGTFMTAIVIFLAGSMFAGMAQSMDQLIAFRALQGLGGGGLMVGALSVIGTAVPLREQGRYQGFIAAVMGVTMVAGPLVGGFITDNLGWRWCFYVNMPLGLLALVAIAHGLKLPRQRSEARIDYAGVALLTLAITSVVLVTAWGGTEYDWTSGTILGLGALGVAAGVGFYFVEHRVAAPVLPPWLFRNPNFSLITGIGVVLGAVLFTVMTFLPIFMQDGQGFSASRASVLLLPNSAASLLTNMTVGRIITKTGRYKIFITGGAALCTVGVAMLSQLTPGSSLAYLWSATVILGFGTSCLMQTAILVTMQSVEKKDLGVGSATSTLARTIGGSVGISVMGVLYASRLPAGGKGSQGYQDAVAEGTGLVFLVTAGLALLTFLAACLLKEIPLSAGSDEEREPAPATVGPA
ncbi:MDR family MFS transporter [Streptomyces sp. NPDC004286]|uniref:MDR family MFS transporter n=1 Tax=Streptomyces sp. NPDC004286 TaxID=3364696 RepID=UPI003681CC0F